MRGVRIIAKPKANPEIRPDFNAKSLKYINDGRFNEYRFSVMLIPNAPDKPETQIKFIKNDKWKTVVMMIFLTLENDCINGVGDQSIDRTTLYSYESDYEVYPAGNPNACEPIPNMAPPPDFVFEDGVVQGAISFSSTTTDIGLNSYVVQGINDINGKI